jgi:hypothetical protein
MDYYTTDMLHEIWPADWSSRRFRHSKWYSGGQGDASDYLNPIALNWQNYHPYACHSCKRGDFTHHTPLSTCSNCHILKYCCREHQKADWKYHKVFCKAFTALRQQERSMDYASEAERKQDIPTLIQELHTVMLSLKKHSVEIQIPVKHAVLLLVVMITKTFIAIQTTQVQSVTITLSISLVWE